MKRPGIFSLAFCAAFVSFHISSTHAAPSTDEAAWLSTLESAVIADLVAGKPLVVQVHVPLCESTILACGNAKLGDGDNPATNLYWATSPGFGKYFARRGSGWSLVLDGDGSNLGESEVLDLKIYRRKVAAPRRWKAAGAPKQFYVYVVAQAWRGTSIDRALSTYANELSGQHPQAIALPDGTKLAAGGAARLIAYVGHNRLMDVAAYAWPHAASSPRGMIAIACHTAAYMQPTLPGPNRVPLLLTRDYLFANAAPLEGTVMAFVDGTGYRGIRSMAARSYAAVQKKLVSRVAGAFTNPAGTHWMSR